MFENPVRRFFKDFQELDKNQEFKIYNEIKLFLRNSDIEPSLYNPQQTKEICNKLYLFLYDKIRKTLFEYDGTHLFHSYKQIEFIEAQRHRLLSKIAQHKEELSEQELNELAYKVKIGSTDKGVTVRFLIDLIIKLGAMGGKKKINESDWSNLFYLSFYLNQFSSISDFIYYGMSETNIEINCEYNYDFKLNYLFKFEEHEKIFSKQYYQFKFELFSEDDMFYEALPKSFRKVSNVFEEKYGFSLINVFKVLKKLGQMELQKVEGYNVINLDQFLKSEYYPLVYVWKDKMINSLKDEWKDEIEPDQIEGIFDFLSLKISTNSLEEPIIPSRLIRKKKRFIFFPIIQSGNALLYGHESCLVAIQLWSSAILAGIYPLPLNDDEPLKIALNKLHDEVDRLLEIKAGDIASNILGKKYVRTRIKNFKRLSKSFPRRPKCGEIDLLAINPKIKLIFIIDAKNYSIKILANDLKNLAKNFFGEKGDLYHLNEKYNFIKKNQSIILDHFKINDKENWSIIKGFIVKEPLKIIFTKDKIVQFVLIDNLKDFLLGNINNSN